MRAAIVEAPHVFVEPLTLEGIRAAVERTLSDECKTADLGGKLTTKQMGDEVLGRLT